MLLLTRGTALSLLLLGACSTVDDKLGDKDWYRQARTATSKAADTAGDAASRAAGKVADTTTKVVAAAPDTAAKAATTASDAAAKAAAVAADRAAKAAVRMQKYLAEKDLLQTFHDASEHSEGAVTDLLHKLGVGSKGAPGATPTPAPGAAGAGVVAGNGVGSPKASPEVSTGANAAASAKGNIAGNTAVNRSGNAKTPDTKLPPTVPEEYTGVYRWPLDAGIVSSEYGVRWGNVHKGIDIAAHTGEPVYAVADGEVIYASDGLRGYGNVVILRHGRRMNSLYAHNSALKVKAGEYVRQGELISLLGSTGHSTGPHVHFELRDGDQALDPRSLLPKGKFAAAGAADHRPAGSASK
jgi:murein DD-endopeptidase MepM/ murein hydrolase activator NlpD